MNLGAVTDTATQQKDRSKDRARLVTVVVAASLIMALSLGIRQCFGLFLAPVTADLALSAAAFSFGLALHNLAWGLTQPLIGMLADRFGPRPIVIACALIYALGIALMAASKNGVVGLDIGIGLLTGLGVAGTGFGVLLGAVSRTAPPAQRSQLVGLVAGLGSAGVLALAPLGQQLIQFHGWRAAAAAYAVAILATVVLTPGIRTRPGDASGAAGRTGGLDVAAAREALGHGGFVAMTVAFFACGFQLMFITAHLPRFLGLCGLPPSVGASALGVIGVCNALGSYAFGLLGARYSRKRLLAAIYAIRTLSIILFISLPVTEFSTLVFAAAMGFTWLGVLPLVSGLIGRMFGLGHFNLLFGLVFLCHQLGGFLGPWVGGLILDATGGYQLAWYAMIAIGAVAALLQWPMDDRPEARLAVANPA